MTRERIVEAAGRLFAVRGFAATLNKAVAAQAGVDIASINYHFGGRDGLYRAVLVEAHRRFVRGEDLAVLVELDAPSFDKLRRLVDLLVQGATKGSGPGSSDTASNWHAQVLSRELLSPTPHIDALQAELQPKLLWATTILADVLKLQKDDPRLMACLISVGAPCAMLLIAQNANTPIATRILQIPKEELVEQLHTFAMGGLEATVRKLSLSRADEATS